MPEELGSSVEGGVTAEGSKVAIGASVVGKEVMSVLDGDAEGPVVGVAEGGEVVVSEMGASVVGKGVVGVPVATGDGEDSGVGAAVVGSTGKEAGGSVGEVPTHIQPASMAVDRKSVQPSGSMIP